MDQIAYAAMLYDTAKTEYAQGFHDDVARCWIDGCGQTDNGRVVRPLVKPAVSGPDGCFIPVCDEHAIVFGETGQYEVA